MNNITTISSPVIFLIDSPVQGPLTRKQNLAYQCQIHKRVYPANNAQSAEHIFLTIFGLFPLCLTIRATIISTINHIMLWTYCVIATCIHLAFVNDAHYKSWTYKSRLIKVYITFLLRKILNIFLTFDISYFENNNKYPLRIIHQKAVYPFKRSSRAIEWDLWREC